MSSPALEFWTQKVITELQKHAAAGCPTCQRLLAELRMAYGVDPNSLILKKGKPQNG